MKKNGIKTIGELVTLRKVELMDFHAIGKFALDEVNQLLKELGLTWQMDLNQIL
jgi:DNA-directed RNA polymerase alpha subunit